MKKIAPSESPHQAARAPSQSGAQDQPVRATTQNAREAVPLAPSRLPAFLARSQRHGRAEHVALHIASRQAGRSNVRPGVRELEKAARVIGRAAACSHMRLCNPERASCAGASRFVARASPFVIRRAASLLL